MLGPGGRARTAGRMLQEGDGQRHEDEAADDEVGGHAVHAVQHRHQRPALVQPVAQRHLLPAPVHLDLQHVACGAAQLGSPRPRRRRWESQHVPKP